MHRVKQIGKFLPMYFAAITGLILLAVLGSRATTALAENAPLHMRNCVIIDAGHGGVDGGATSCTGVLESNINLEIAVRLNDLMHLLGIDTVMIRTSDQSIHTEGNSIQRSRRSSYSKYRQTSYQIYNIQDNEIANCAHYEHKSGIWGEHALHEITPNIGYGNILAYYPCNFYADYWQSY